MSTNSTLLETLPEDSWTGDFAPDTVSRATAALEGGQVLYFPHLAFRLEEAEQPLLSESVGDGKSKNISFDPARGILRGAAEDVAVSRALHGVLDRFAKQARALVSGALPGYKDHLEWGLTSYRPARVEGRVTSWRKDDTRLHVDAFPSRPTRGRRILRVFANLGESGRVWHLGEAFEAVAGRFAPAARLPLPGSAWILETLRIVKGRRSAFDHVMIQIHDRMKADQGYQEQAIREQAEFPPGSAWIVFTDQVSHAALSGQFALEQTFFVPITALAKQETAPLRVLEKTLGRGLV